MSRAPSSPSTEPPAPKGRRLRLRTSTELYAKGALSASIAGSAPSFIWAETVSQFSSSDWDALSRRASMRKLYPALDADSGMQFPKGACLGNWRPESSQIMGCSFPKGIVPESVSHSEPSNRDALSRRGPKWKPHPVSRLPFKLECRLSTGIGYLPSSSSASSLA